jgi:dolichyl-phosphate beta-glucosyltransferase
VGGHSERQPAAVIVVPCFNEAGRLAVEQLDELAADDAIGLVLVDDGSTDGTASLLHRFAADRERVEVCVLASNAGKGSAVRHGLQVARRSGAAWVGYCDADFATPAAEVRRLVTLARERPELAVVLGSRLALLGRTIGRRALRHAGGRVFAAGAARALRLPVHDTQCGAKILRADATLDLALARPFRSRWAFDVELLGRLTALGVPAFALWEEPLREWHDVPGSKRTLVASVRATFELVPIARELRRWRM